jgi:hypothetical protein
MAYATLDAKASNVAFARAMAVFGCSCILTLLGLSLCAVILYALFNYMDVDSLARAFNVPPRSTANA